MRANGCRTPGGNHGWKLSGKTYKQYSLDSWIGFGRCRVGFSVGGTKYESPRWKNFTAQQ